MEAAMKNDIEMAIGTSAADSEPSNCSNSKEKTMMASSSNKQGESINSMGLEHYSAAAKGDFEKFEHSDSVALAKILTPTDNTILHIHITARPRSKSSQNIDFLRGILGKCPDLLWKVNKKGETLLHMAARHGHADVAMFLLEECKKSFQNDQGSGIKATTQMLQKTNEARDTALHEAVRYSHDHLDVVEVLTKADPDLTYEANTAGETPLYLAVERGYKEVLKEILKTCTSPGDHGPYDRTALHVAVIRKDGDMVKLLLDEKKIHKSKKDENGWTPLHFAAHLGDIEIMNKLLSKDNSAAYEADNEGKTALHVAAGRGRVDIMRELISKCPDCCELVDKRDRNVLHFALESRNKKAVKLVLENPWLGNLINEKDENGNTPFLKAVSMGICYTFTMLHPKLDTQVFNHHNHNFVDIMLANSSHYWFFEMMPDFFLQLFENRRGFQMGLRLIVSKNEIIGEGEDEGNTVKSKSKEGEVADEGNRMSCKSKDGKNRRVIKFLEEAREKELVAATLIATVTFAAGFTVPGGFVADKGPDQGAAILTGNTAFTAFVILNTISFILSSLAVFNRVSIMSASTHHQDMLKLFKQSMTGQDLIYYAMLAMIGAFISGTCAVVRDNKSLAIMACVMPVAIFAFIRIENCLMAHFLYYKYVKN